ncbi:MAG: aminotransferase class IV [Saprospiraceae bacterium]
MYPFIETIRLIDGRFRNVEFHNERVRNTFMKFYPQHEPHDLKVIISQLGGKSNGRVKVLYNSERLYFSISPIFNLKTTHYHLLESPRLRYDFKFYDRLSLVHVQRNDRYIEPVFCRNGMITDTSRANLIFREGSKWYTPDTFLLNGSMRQSLLSLGYIQSTPIHKSELYRFNGFKPINALNHPDEVEEHDISLLLQTK